MLEKSVLWIQQSQLMFKLQSKRQVTRAVRNKTSTGVLFVRLALLRRSFHPERTTHNTGFEYRLESEILHHQNQLKLVGNLLFYFQQHLKG
ncbi:hypothetical protein Bpfe_024078 [Biomphalaria pfeifferi]|uniref:Uncharacterized protein n=1 Tax=Biomphalaria pfeifferi TaxID=112525 RepID=A0AAD8F068_BIOPF|nr:hypothetical protein Bpfe_024078 [Biomphalaria pfeifferi]